MGSFPQICEKVVMQLNDEPLKLTKVLFFLAVDQLRTNCIEVLSRNLNNDGEFRRLVNFLVEDISELERNPEYKMADIWVAFEQPIANQRVRRGQQFDFQLLLAKKERFELIFACLVISILMRLGILNPEMLSKMLPTLLQGNLSFNLPFKDIIKMAQELSGERYEVTAGFGYFVYDTWQYKKRWHNSEISGVRCIKKTVDSFAELGAGVTGVYGGEFFGSAIANAKIVHLAGGVSVGLASTVLGGTLCDRFTQQIFNLPKDDSLENAFRFLELPWTASDNEINLSYIRLAHLYYRDAENWRRLETSFERIKFYESFPN
ncbi:hypothetical protein GHT06_019492 [Daphnia sinensis]|uniref:Uncharacterized protein n=1 Tax=Daphnia sinensis TaxID=1820382 RepID=A0AAD5PT63_9CRUS|nr:hypothetical protein GHT06_019492 [Daphnia sinensis]